MTFILTREQRNLFNLHWKSLVAASVARPVKPEVFAELIIMRYPVDKIQEQLLKAFAPSIPCYIRFHIKNAREDGTIPASLLEQRIHDAPGYHNFHGLWTVMHALRKHYFGLFRFSEVPLPKRCNKLHISSKVWLEQEQLELLLKTIDGVIKQLRKSTADLMKVEFKTHDYGRRGEPISEDEFYIMAAEAHSYMFNRKGD